MPEAIAIRGYLDVALTPDRVSEIDAIFFESSNTKSFDSETARTAFRERWLGRYLKTDPKFAYVAQAADGRIVGYLVGAIDDPARAARFSDIGYFSALAEVTQRYPAHLHVNVSPEFRNHGLGARLIDAFAADAKAAGAPGMHVVTSVGSENVRFYNRNGFEEVARTGEGRRLVCLAKAL